MTKFQLTIIGILDGSYNLTPAEVNLEQRLWERHYSTEDENINIDSKEERIKKLKEYNREYHREYYRRKLAKGKWTADRAYTTGTEGSVSKSKDKSQNKRQADYRNKLCNYLNETVKFGTLIHRFYKDFGSWSLATAEAKKYLLEKDT